MLGGLAYRLSAALAVLSYHHAVFPDLAELPTTAPSPRSAIMVTVYCAKVSSGIVDHDRPRRSSRRGVACRARMSAVPVDPGTPSGRGMRPVLGTASGGVRAGSRDRGVIAAASAAPSDALGKLTFALLVTTFRHGLAVACRH
jgi:hypothetical protein